MFDTTTTDIRPATPKGAHSESVAPDKSASQRIDLAGGQRLLIETSGATTMLNVESAGGTLVQLRITKDGAQIFLDQSCEIRSKGDITLEGETLTLRARNELKIESAGDASLDIQGNLSSTARAQSIRSTLGNVDVKANDDVSLRAERILLNT